MNPNPFRVVVRDVVVFHHLYIGLLLMIGSHNPNDIMYWIGSFIFGDDAYEHMVDYNSPLRILFDRYISPRLS